MSDGEGGETGTATPRTVGERLRAAREAQSLSAADIAARTRITQRYLEAIEANRFNDLPSPTYAAGFAKAYARAVGMDQVAVGRDIRAEMDAPGAVQRTYHHVQEIADPARGPSRGLVIVAAGLALAVLILAILWFSTGMFHHSGEQTVPDAQPSVSAAVPAPAASPTAAASGPVVLTANAEVWLRVYDAANKTLYLGTMKPGDRFEVPANADDPKINVGRPDKLTITVGGRAVPPLGDGSRPIKDVRVSAAALAPQAGAGSIALVPQPGASPSSTPSANARSTERTTARPRATATRRSRETSAGSAADEVRRANQTSTPAAAPTTSAPPGAATP